MIVKIDYELDDDHLINERVATEPSDHPSMLAWLATPLMPQIDVILATPGPGLPEQSTLLAQ